MHREMQECIVLKIGGRVLLQLPSDDSLDLNVFRGVCSAGCNLIAAGSRRLLVVPGGAGSHIFVDPARQLDMSEAECDQIGISVTRVIAGLLLAGFRKLGADVYPAVVSSPETLNLAGSHRIVVAAPGGFSTISSDSLAAIIAEQCRAVRLLLIKRRMDEQIGALMQEDATGRFITIDSLIATLPRCMTRASAHPFLDILSLKIIERSGVPTSLLFRDDFLRATKDEIEDVISAGIRIRV